MIDSHEKKLNTSPGIQQAITSNSSPCYLIAEVGQAHDGSLGTAHSYIDAIAKAGANAVKFQTHIASAESTRRDQFRVDIFPQDATRFDYWRRMEFTPAQWQELREHALSVGLEFLSTPFSVEAISLLEAVGVPAWKIGSGETSNSVILDSVLETSKPIILSTGLVNWEELDKVVSKIIKAKVPFAILQCTTSYPCPLERVGLNAIQELRERYGCPVGLSDHSGSIFPSVAATVLGANIIETHVVFNKDCFGPDVSSSLTLDDFSQLVRGVREIEICKSNPIDKDYEFNHQQELRILFSRSIVAARDLPQGKVLESCDIAYKKPGGGLPVEDRGKILGKTLNRHLAEDEPIEESDVSG